MFKKIASLAIAATMMVGTAAITASAAEVEADTVGAEDSAVVSADSSSEVGADAGSDSVGAGNTLSFDVNSAGWKNYKKIFCHIWVYGGDQLNPWQSKKESCKDNGDGTFTYDLSKVTIESGTLYAVIFSADTGMQTYDLLFDSTCSGDTAYCDGTTYENPVDSTKTGQAAFWKNQDKTKFGPVKQVTSIGNIVGTCIPSTTSAYSMFTSFLTANLTSAKTYSGKDDQTLIDDVAKELGLYQDDVEKAIKETGLDGVDDKGDPILNWDKSKSTLPGGENKEAQITGDGSNGGSSNNGGTSTNTSSGSGSGSGSSSVKSGVETTILYVFGGLMLAAAGVAFLARKKREE